jgi:hypothetical protein
MLWRVQGEIPCYGLCKTPCFGQYMFNAGIHIFCGIVIAGINPMLWPEYDSLLWFVHDEILSTVRCGIVSHVMVVQR